MLNESSRIADGGPALGGQRKAQALSRHCRQVPEPTSQDGQETCAKLSRRRKRHPGGSQSPPPSSPAAGAALKTGRPQPWSRNLNSVERG